MATRVSCVVRAAVMLCLLGPSSPLISWLSHRAACVVTTTYVNNVNETFRWRVLRLYLHLSDTAFQRVWRAGVCTASDGGCRHPDGSSIWRRTCVALNPGLLHWHVVFFPLLSAPTHVFDLSDHSVAVCLLDSFQFASSCEWRRKSNLFFWSNLWASCC